MQTDTESLISLSKELQHSNPKLALCLYLQSTCGLRVSEVLRIKYKDLSKAGLIKIKLSKTNEFTTVSSGEFTSFVKSLKGDKDSLVFEFTRYYVYREYRKLGIITNNSTKNKKAVTHAPRHILAKEIRQNFDGEGISNTLRHKSSKTQEYYGKG